MGLPWKRTTCWSPATVTWVMLIMLDTSYDLTAQSFVDAFGKVVGEPEFVI